MTPPPPSLRCAKTAFWPLERYREYPNLFKLIANRWAWRWCLPKWAVILGEQRALSHKPWGGHTGIHGNSASSNHPPGTVTLTKSVEILTNPILTNSTNEGGKGRGKSWTTDWNAAWKQTAPHAAEVNNTCESRNPVCHLEAHDSLTTADQHWLDFNLS